MPTYEYKHTATGEIVEVVMTIAEMQEKQDKNGYIILPDGVAGKRIYTSPPAVPNDAKWPIHSNAIAVGLHEVDAARENMAKHKVDLEFDSKGRGIIKSSKHQREVCKAMERVTGTRWINKDSYI